MTSLPTSGPATMAATETLTTGPTWTVGSRLPQVGMSPLFLVAPTYHQPPFPIRRYGRGTAATPPELAAPTSQPTPPHQK